MSEHPWPRRVERVEAVLTDRWQTFDVVGARSALEAKQLTGALVWLRNRGRVHSRFTSAGLTQWRRA